MIGYVLDGNVSEAMTNVESEQISGVPCRFGMACAGNTRILGCPT